MINLPNEDLGIKLMHQKYQQWHTTVFIGKQNPVNKNDLKALVYDIAQELNVENLRSL